MKNEGKKSKKIPGHPADLSDSVRLLLTDAKSHVFEINGPSIYLLIHRKAVTEIFYPYPPIRDRGSEYGLVLL